MNPKISIIVPVYKVEPYLRKCIDSILNQTFKDFELILVDDGSPDNCGKICDEYAKKDERIIVIHKDNGGVSMARNAALNIAKGDYIGFVDSDDYIESYMYEELYNKCKLEEADISIIGTREINEKGKMVYEYIPNVINFSEILKRAHPWNKLFDRKLFFDNNLFFSQDKYYEDLELIPKLFVKAKKVCKVDNIGYIYLQRKGSITRQKDEKILDMLWAYKEIKMFLLDENAWNEYEMEFCIAVEYFKKFFLNILRECSTIFIIKNYKYIVFNLKEISRFNSKNAVVFFIKHLKTKFFM